MVSVVKKNAEHTQNSRGFLYTEYIQRESIRRVYVVRLVYWVVDDDDTWNTRWWMVGDWMVQYFDTSEEIPRCLDT